MMGEVRTLVNDSHLRRIEPTPLSPDTVEALLHRVPGSPIADDSLEQLVVAATGNPGVLRQLVELGVRRGPCRARWHVAPHAAAVLRVADVRAARLRAARGAAPRRACSRRAPRGRGDLGLDLLEKMASGEILEELEGRGLLDGHDSAQRVEVSLSHPLFGEVINMQLPVVRGRRIRRTLADAVSPTARVTGAIQAARRRVEPGGRRACRRVLARGGRTARTRRGRRVDGRAHPGSGARRRPHARDHPARGGAAFPPRHDPRGRGAARVDRQRRARRSGPHAGGVPTGHQPLLRSR